MDIVFIIIIALVAIIVFVIQGCLLAYLFDTKEKLDQQHKQTLLLAEIAKKQGVDIIEVDKILRSENAKYFWQ